ncbi:MAG: LptF/LptG family permease [Rhabdochlamydiaceae bacterium]|nr:LptF/LptG family permease [Candidatus Amphrikana amoebophyrae]
MPIIWRYLLRNYFKIFSLSIFVFISMLILMRMQEIARFATLGTSISTILFFILYQFPLILPLAIPISALIASTLLMGKLSSSHELTSLRAQGYSIKEVLFPIRLIAFSLALLNFFIVSELTPGTKLKSKNLVYQATAHNPLMLLRLNKNSKIKNSYADLQIINSGKSAKDFLFSFVNPKSGKLNLFLADKLTVQEQGVLIGDQVSFISILPSNKENSFDHLLIENHNSIRNSSLAIASLLHETDIKKQTLKKLKIKPLLIKTFIDKNSEQTIQCITEISRRIYLALVTFSFSMLGALFSIQIGRIKKRKGLLVILIFSSIALAAYLLTKGNSSNMYLVIAYFALPQIAILVANRIKLNAIERGIE